MDSLADSQSVLESSSADAVMSQFLPTAASQDTELPSTNLEGEAGLNPTTAPCVGTEEFVGASAILEATRVESSMPATQAASGMPPPEDEASGTGEEGRIDGDWGDAIDVDANEDENENEDEDEPESGSSDVSDGGDLKEDLENALEGDFNFKGSYYYGRVAADAPNPCLNIDGLGPVGLPLSPRDAKSIIECSAQAPFGHGERTVVDTEVRDTWEIEPTRVKFDNPAWAQFVQTSVIPTVWQALGVAPSSVPPRCELYKLLLYETGSHFLPHQDTEKAEGMFATVVILLPSPYSGGQVHVSHASSTKILDMAATSLLSTSVLAWYTDVRHEVKPITSGYRLALSYNLIHTSSGVPKPSLPDMNTALTHLRHVLHKWRKGAYVIEADRDIVAYLLKHEYSAANLARGAKTLKGEDAHKVANLRIVAEELGFMVCLANLSYNVTGVADDDFGYRDRGWKRGRYGYSSDDDDDDGETPSMIEVSDTSLEVSNLVDLQGNSLLGQNTVLHIDENNLIPEDPFEGVEPDKKEYEGYMGNGAGSLDHWYHRTVLVLLHEHDATSILFSAGGVTYALQRLKTANSTIPTADDRTLADLVLRSLASNDKVTATTMADFAMKWNDLDRWKEVIKKSGLPISTFDIDKLLQAWKMFSFEGVRVSFEELLLRSTSLSDRIAFINALSPHSSDEHAAVQKWSQEQETRAFASFNTPTVEDIPALIEVTCLKGVSFLIDVILPQLVKNTSIYTFCVAFIKALQQNKTRLLETSTPTLTQSPDDSTNNSFEKLVDQCLDMVVRQWQTVVAQPVQPYLGYLSRSTPVMVQESKILRILELVELCLLTGHMMPCKKLFVILLKVQGTAFDKFKTLYNPLIPRLRELLGTKGIDICSSPFADLLQLLIGSYLRDVLGARSCNVNPAIRKIGCGCADCNQVNTFLASSSATQQMFRYPQARRTHVERHLSAVSDLVTFQTVRSGSPHGVSVTKRPEIVAASQWASRVAQAKTFLRTIGDDDVLSRLMGNRYADLLKALQGTQQFTLTVSDAATNTSVRPGVLHNLRTGIAASSSSVPPVAPAAGTKRKKRALVSTGPVIDLTAEDSS